MASESIEPRKPKPRGKPFARGNDMRRRGNAKSPSASQLAHLGNTKALMEPVTARWMRRALAELEQQYGPCGVRVQHLVAFAAMTIQDLHWARGLSYAKESVGALAMGWSVGGRCATFLREAAELAEQQAKRRPVDTTGVLATIFGGTHDQAEREPGATPDPDPEVSEPDTPIIPPSASSSPPIDAPACPVCGERGGLVQVGKYLNCTACGRERVKDYGDQD